MKAVALQLSISNLTSHSPLLHSSNKFSLSLKPRIQIPTRISARAVPARDRVIDFGKHKGKMLGTLPSSYLRWVSDNLRARDFEDWAKLANEVLGDPVYRDRIEWESAEKVLNGDVSSRSSSSAARSDGAVSELLEISERFGWDNKDKVGWSKIDFGLLGTSRGGRIPRRVSEKRELGLMKSEKVDCRSCYGEESKRRRERRERVRAKSSADTKVSFAEEKIGEDEVVFGSGDEEDRRGNSRSPFPGRESLLKKGLGVYYTRYAGRGEVGQVADNHQYGFANSTRHQLASLSLSLSLSLWELQGLKDSGLPVYFSRLLLSASFHSLMTDRSDLADTRFGKLPDHLLIEIFVRVPISEWVQLSCVKKQWANLFREECFWHAALLRTFPLAGHAKRWPGPIPQGMSKRRYAALYISKHMFSLDDELDEILGHSYMFLKEQLEISTMPPPAGILHGTIIDQFIACGKSRDKAHELASQIWLAVIDNLEENEKTFRLLKRLALEGEVFLPYPYTRSQKVQWRVFEKLFTDFRDCFNHEDYYDVLACAKHKFQPIPSAWLGY